MNLKPIALACALAMLPATSIADNSITRELKRAIITHCQAENLGRPAVIFQTGEAVDPFVQSVEDEGELPVDVNCIYIDSYTDNVVIAGSLVITSAEDSGAITTMMIDTSVHTTAFTYRFGDWADAKSHQGNGAEYTMVSNLKEDSFGKSLEYPVHFLRRTPNECMETSGVIGPCPDQTTMLTLQLSPGVFATFDFRNVEPTE